MLPTSPALSSLPRQDTAKKKAADQFHVIHKKIDRFLNHQIKLTKSNSEKKKTWKQKSKNKTKTSECFLSDAESRLKKQVTEGEEGQLEGRGQVREKGEVI